MYRASFTVLY